MGLKIDTSNRDFLPRAAGVTVGALAAWRATGTSLMKRRPLDTFAAAALSFLVAGAGAWGATSLAQWGARGVQGKGWADDDTRNTMRNTAIAAAVVGVGLMALRRWGHNASIKASQVSSPMAVEALDGAGKRFVSEVTQGLAKQPVRVFGSLKAGANVDERVRVVVRELGEKGAFSRSHIVVASPTGSGYVEPVLLESIERMTDGDVAIATIQSNNLPSALSIPKIPVAAESHRKLLEAINAERLVRFPEGGGPKVHVTGISHGAWSSSDVFVHNPEKMMSQLGVDSALWVGMPGLAKWDRKYGGTGKVGAITVFSNVDDPVNRFNLRLVAKKPDWLQSGIRPAEISPDQKYSPVSTFVQTAIDLKNATAPNQGTGVFVRKGHEYRDQLAELVRDAFSFSPISDARFAGIQASVRRSAAT